MGTSERAARGARALRALAMAGVVALTAWGCGGETGGDGAGTRSGSDADASDGRPAFEWPAGARHWGFDEDALDGGPAGFTTPVGIWAVETADDDRVLTQRDQGPDHAFNIALADGTSARDLDLWVQVQAVSGVIDQGGGVVWRAAGPDDYYIARWNPLERNFRVYTVKDGVRRQLDSALTDLDPDGWHLLRVTMRGDHIQCRLDGELLLDVRDDTFDAAGAVGLWTKADAITRFDDLVLAVRDG